MSRLAILKRSSFLGVMVFLSRILGLLREMLKSHFLGNSALADSFTIAFRIPNLLRRLFAEGNMTAAFVPTFVGYLRKGVPARTRRFLSATCSFGTFVFTAAVLLGIATAPLLVKLMAAEMSTAYEQETVLLTRIMFPYLGFISLAALVQGVLNGHDRYGPSGFTPVLFNLCFIGAAVLLSGRMENPARAMAVGVLVGGAVQLLFQVPFFLRTGSRFRLWPIWKAVTHPGTRKVLALIAPTVLGLGAYQLNIVVSSRIATNTGVGIVSALEYSNRLLEVVLGIFIVSLGTVILTELSRLAHAGDWDGFNRQVRFALRLMAVLTVPVTVYTLLFHREIVTAVFRSGRFQDRAVDMTSSALFYHIIGLYFVAANRILPIVFYAMRDTRTPTIAGIVSVTVNLIIAVLLAGPMAQRGIALAATVSAMAFTAVLVAAVFRLKQINHRELIAGGGYAVKIAAASLPAAAAAYGLMPVLKEACQHLPTRFLSIGVPLAGTAIVFYLIIMLILLILRDRLLRDVGRRLRKKRGKK
jgi:putative peptidoglycan lipid II flippase